MNTGEFNQLEFNQETVEAAALPTVNPMWYYGINTGEFNQLEFNVTTIETVQPSTSIAVFMHHYNQMKEN